MGCKLEAFILDHQAAEMLPDNLRHLHRFRLNDQLGSCTTFLAFGSNRSHGLS